MKKLPIKNYEQAYEIASNGNVYSLPRKVLGTDGTIYPFKGKLLTTHVNVQNGYSQVDLWDNNAPKRFYIHRLLAIAFISNPNCKPEINHKDGNRQNNSLSNLEWCTSSENSYHAVNTGLRTYTNRLTRNEFICCLQEIIQGENYTALSERVPYKVPFLSTKLRKIAREENIEHLLDESLREQKRRRARSNGVKNR